MRVIPIITELIRARREQLILAFMLELLHLSIWLEFGSPLSRSLMLVHLGLFLIWQPVWRSDEKLRWYNGLVFILLTLAFVAWLNHWVLYGWLLLLTGFAGGRVLISRHERNTYMIVLVFLISELLIGCTTQLVGINLKIHEFFNIALPSLPLLILIIPTVPVERRIRSVDILHAVMSSMFAGLLSLGSLLNMFISNTQYIIALTQTMLIIGLFMLLISWLVSPRGGFSGLYQLWTRSLLNIGTPFEHWLSELSDLAQARQSADKFLEATMDKLVKMPWITGLRWQTPNLDDTCGELTSHETELNFDELTVCIYTRHPVGGALLLHCTLLVQLIHNYYVAKQREHELTKQTHLQAIYETGARITHDIKNLLQSLHAITSILLHDKDDENKSVAQKVIEKQLPNLTKRLQLALDKLQAPQSEESDSAYLKDWWHNLKIRNNFPNVTYHDEISGDPLIPVDLFDSIIDNLLENAHSKSLIEKDIEITIMLMSDSGIIKLSFCDTGSMISEDTARRLFQEPLDSDNGLGIGLYQAARQAEIMEYSLELKHNQPGRVCFELSNLQINSG